MTGALKEVALAAVPVGRLRETAGPIAWERLTDAHARAGELLAGRSLWSINSTAIGGGVAEMLRTMLPYTRAGGVDARWLVVRGSADFFCVTKRIHNFLHGHLGDGGPLGEAERGAYERVLEDAGWALRDVIRPGDVVVLHDPQTVGLVCRTQAAGRDGDLALPHRHQSSREGSQRRRGTSSGPMSKSRTWWCSRGARACPRDCRGSRSG